MPDPYALTGDWRATAGSLAHYWFNSSVSGLPIQSFARPVCRKGIRHRSAEQVRVLAGALRVCPECLAWFGGHPESQNFR